jgi:hypothetical protein
VKLSNNQEEETMAPENTTAPTGNENSAVGKVLIISGTVQAQSPDGTVRTLQVNSPIYPSDRIITGESGMISIAFNDADQNQLDLGRLSDVLITEDIFLGTTPVDMSETIAEVEAIQQALLNQEIDPTEDLEAPAAGPNDGGGGQVFAIFELTGEEVTPEAGAETSGVGLNFVQSSPTILAAEPIGEILIFEELPVFAEPTTTIIGDEPDIPDTPEDPDLLPPSVSIWNDINNNGEFDSGIDNAKIEIRVSRSFEENSAGTDKDFIGDILVEQQAVTPELLASNPPSTTILTHTSDIIFTFLSEGADFQSTVGWYDVNDPTVGYVVWSNVSAQGSGGDLVPGVSSVVVESVPAGTQLGFFLIPDAISPIDAANQDIPDTVYFFEGRAYFDAEHTQLINSTDNIPGQADPDADPTWFSNSENIDGVQHAITGLSENDGQNVLYVGFEDLAGGGDKDYNDVIFKVDLGGGEKVEIDPASLNIGVAIADSDSANLSQAVLSFELGDGDEVSFTPVVGLTVERVGDTFTITGNAPIESYNQLLDSFTVSIGGTTDNNNPEIIDTTPRQSTVQVWDETDQASDPDTAIFEVEIVDEDISESEESEEVILAESTMDMSAADENTGMEPDPDFSNQESDPLDDVPITT